MTTPPEHGWGEATPPQPRYGQYGPGDGTQGPTPPNASQPQYGQPQYGQPQYGDSQYGQPGGGPAGFGQFQAPDKPGIIPLRPLRLGEFLDGAFGALRANPRVMLGFTAVVISIAVAIATFGVYVARNPVRNLFSDGPDTGDFNMAAELDVLEMQVSSSGISLIMLFVVPLMTGLLIASVSRSVIGQKTTMKQVWALSKRKLGFLLLLTLLLGLASSLAIAAYIALIALLATVANGWAAVAFGIVGAIGLIIGHLWIMVRTLLIPPILVLEDARFWGSVKRAWVLSRGSFWRLFGIYLFTQVIVGVVSSIIVTPASFIATFLAVGTDTMSGIPLLIMSLASVLIYTITVSFTAAVVALLYIDLRIRREGLDVELTAAARAQGN